MESDDRLGGRVNVRPTKFEFVDTNCDQTFDKELECIIVLCGRAAGAFSCDKRRCQAKIST